MKLLSFAFACFALIGSVSAANLVQQIEAKKAALSNVRMNVVELRLKNGVQASVSCGDCSGGSDCGTRR
jgi:hypothetical protein